MLVAVSALKPSAAALRVQMLPLLVRGTICNLDGVLGLMNNPQTVALFFPKHLVSSINVDIITAETPGHRRQMQKKHSATRTMRRCRVAVTSHAPPRGFIYRAQPSNRTFRNHSRSASPMSSEASLPAHTPTATGSLGGRAVEARNFMTSTGIDDEYSAPQPRAPCPPQLSEETIASIPLELPPLDQSRMSPAVVSAAELLRVEYAITSSQTRSSLLSMRKTWMRWHQLPVAPPGNRNQFVSVLSESEAAVLRYDFMCLLEV
jgi:hypothetical protein